MRKLKIRNFFFKIHNLFITSEVGIYKRKQESKKTRTRPRKRSRIQENKKENKNSPKKRQIKKGKTFFS